MGVHAIILGLALRNRLRLLRHNIANRRNRYTSPAFSEIKRGFWIQMHGIVFSQLRKYLETKHGRHAWNTLLKHAKLENRAYLSVSEYPDAEMEALVSAAAMMSGQPATVVLEDFGVFIALPLMNMYGHLIPEEWKTLDVIEKTEETIHNVVRVQAPGAKPPVLRSRAKMKWC